MSSVEESEITVTECSREAKVIPGTVHGYIKLGLIKARKLSNGMHMLPASAVDDVKAIYARRISNRGRRPS